MSELSCAEREAELSECLQELSSGDYIVLPKFVSTLLCFCTNWELHILGWRERGVWYFFYV